MSWYDLFKIFSYSFTQDPLAKKTDKKDLPSAGVTSPDSVLDLRNLETLNSGGAFIRVQNELVDMTTATNRLNRYKEYDRLCMSTPEIEMAMTVFADEACVSGETLIATVWGNKTIKWLTENKKEERFPVYCYDFEKEDYTIGWAFDPRCVKTAPTIKIALDNGSTEIVTTDHRILKKNGEWVHAGELKFGDELMPFYRINPNQYHTKNNANQYPRVFTQNYGWMHERQFIDEWKTGERIQEFERVNKLCRLISDSLKLREIEELMGFAWNNMEMWLKKYGTSYKEMHFLGKKLKHRRVIGVMPYKEVPVYDLSVEKHQNFATNSLIMHNCQKDDINRCCKISCKNASIIDELEYLFFHRDMLNMDQQSMWDKAKRLFIKGDLFWELVIDPDNPKDGIYRIQDLPAETMFKIETIRGKVIEYQQTKETPDYNAIVKAPVATATEAELQQSTAIRFTPEQIVHIKIGDYRRTFYPYGVSLIEPARGPAHQLRIMEDSMVVYRLCIRSYDKITTEDGWKYMKDITNGDVIWSYSSDRKRLEKTQVVWHGNIGKKPVFKVASKHTSVTGTDIHPILVCDKTTNKVSYVNIKDLVVGKHQFVRPIFGETHEVSYNITEKFAEMLGNKFVDSAERIPVWLFRERKFIKEAFMRGLISKGNDINSKNKLFLEDIKHLWELLGYHASEITSNNGWNLNLSKTKVPFYDDIIDIESVGEEDVYDLTVNHEEHNFLNNGVPVHNSRAPERRCFYIDVGTLPPYKTEAFMDRIKDQFRKKKIPRQQFAQGGPSAVEERFHVPAVDEDYWIPTRPNSNTRIDTLPGAQNLGEIDDAVYFRNKLYTALNFPKNYFSTEDPNSTRITLSAQDVKFARMIERLQSHMEEGLHQVADRHLKLRGFPTESFEDLSIKMTPPSDWRELSRAEITTNRINNANSLKGSQLMSDYDIFIKTMKCTEDETKEMLSRLKVQKLEDLKLQILAQNPALLGVGMPGQGEQEMGAEPGGPGGELNPGPGMPGQPPGGMPPEGLGLPGQPPGGTPPQAQGAPPPLPPEPQGEQGQPLPTPRNADIVKYDLEITSYESEQDFIQPDFTDTEE